MEGEGMSAALSALCDNARKFFSVECEYSEEGDVSVKDGGAASNLYRIAQECVSNVVKHG